MKPLTAYYKKHPYQGKTFIRNLMKERYSGLPSKLTPLRYLSDYETYNDSEDNWTVIVESHSPIMKSCMRQARKKCKIALIKSHKNNKKTNK